MLDTPGFREVWRIYRRNAKTRAIPFYLSKAEFYSLITSPCHYCGIPPHQTTCKLDHNGIDRLDSSKAYEVDNCAPACKYCNYMKSSMSIDRFIMHVAQVYLNQIKGVSRYGKK